MTLELIKLDLPDMPEDVIDIWLLTHFKRFGWPPRVDNDWRYILGLGNDLKFLQRLKWHKETLAITPPVLTARSLQMITDLFKTYVLKQFTWYSAISDGPGRFRSCCDYLKQHGRFPKPVVLRKTEEGYVVLDGNHRITAFFYLYGFFKIQHPEIPSLKVSDRQEAWIAI